jgi:lipopolysaccharide/colanic/teichoic acid biosynthesis glycosyltransferase
VSNLTQSVPPPTRARRGEAAAGRGIDLVVAAVALLVLTWAMLLIALAVRLTSTGPALFAQTRIGLDGRRFAMYKFRTMHVGVDDTLLRALISAELRGEDTSVEGSYKLAADPRVTPLGAFLRRTSLDELPQLINVLLGDMSLVGPRPCLEWEAELFPAEFRPRFTVRPGITGLWQVSGRSSVSTLDMLQLDLTYVRTRTLPSDLAILARTVPALLHAGGTR